MKMRFIKLEDKFNQKIKTVLFIYIYIYIFKTFGRIKLIKKKGSFCIVASKKKKRNNSYDENSISFRNDFKLFFFFF